MNTFIKALRRPTSATQGLTNAFLLVSASTGLGFLFWTQVLPAFAAVGYPAPFSSLVIGVAVGFAGLVALFVTSLLDAWPKIVSDQAANDAAGFNIVGQKEQRDMDRYERAVARLKAKKRAAKMAASA